MFSQQERQFIRAEFLKQVQQQQQETKLIQEDDGRELIAVPKATAYKCMEVVIIVTACVIRTLRIRAFPRIRGNLTNASMNARKKQLNSKKSKKKSEKCKKYSNTASQSAFKDANTTR